MLSWCFLASHKDQNFLSVWHFCCQHSLFYAPQSQMRLDQVTQSRSSFSSVFKVMSLGHRHEAAANSGLGNTLPAR